MSDDARLFVEALIVAIVAIAMTAVIGYSVHGALQERRRRHTPDALLKISRAYSELAERVTQLEHDRARDHETIMQLRVQVEEWAAYGRLLAAKLREFTDDVPPAPKSTAVVNLTNEHQTVAQAIAMLFSLDEIDDLAFRMGISPGQISGDTTTKRARELVDYMRRHNRLDELVGLARQLRPTRGI